MNSTRPSPFRNHQNLAGHYYQDGVNASFGHTAAFTYDHLNRLTASVATPLQQGGSAHNLAFSYDRYGNMTCTLNGQTNGPCPQWGYSATSNRLTNSGFTYDASGDLTADGSHTYQWDAEGRLSSVDSGSTATYTYNALGQRVEKKVGSTYTELAYDSSGEPVGENNRSVWPATYITFNGRHLANYQNSATYFSHGGSLGTTGMVTDYAGNVAQDELHYPWGQQWSMGGTLQEERFARFHRRDAETGLDPTHFRMYTANQGRWLIPDPASTGSASLGSPQSLNRYAYVMNRPSSATDARGLYIHVPVVGDANSIGFSMDFILPGGNIAPLLSGLYGGGGGPLGTVSKTYSKSMQCSKTAAQIMSTVEGNFGSVADFSTGGPPEANESCTFSPPQGQLKAGQSIPIGINVGVLYSLNTSVNVTAVTPTSLTFSTVPGHLLYPATITFSASDAGGGSINFNISLQGAFPNLINEVLFYAGGSSFEDAQWNHFLQQVAGLCAAPKH